MKKAKHAVSVIILAAWTATVFPMVPMVPRPNVAQENTATTPVKPVPAPFTGVKKRISVGKFDAVSAVAYNFAGTDIGGGVAAQLTTALVESGRFLVLERANMGEIQREQQLAAQRISPSETSSPATPTGATSTLYSAAGATSSLYSASGAPSSLYPAAPGANAPLGKLIDAQMLIAGSVTEFEQGAKGGGLSIGFGPARMGRKVVEGHLGMDIRLIDTTTGQVLVSKRVEARVPESNVALELNVRDVIFGGENFKKTPLGKATREAIEKAVALIIKEMEVVPWTGRVADLMENQVLVNAGKDMGLQPGMIFMVSSVVKEVIDPATGGSLGVIEAPRGEIKVEQVQDKFSVASLVTGTLPKKGDLLRLKK